MTYRPINAIKAFVVALIICIANSDVVYASIQLVPKQNNDETLITPHTKIGGFLGPVVKFSRLNENPAVLVGLQGGVIFNRSFVIGLEGYGLANQIDVSKVDDRAINFGYGGIFLGYVNSAHKLIHLSLHSLIGTGGLRYWECFDENWNDNDGFDDLVFVFEPGLDLELNVTKYFRMGIGGTYRFVQGVTFAGLSNNDIGGPSASLVLKFGIL